jgi:hypothetical protein
MRFARKWALPTITLLLSVSLCGCGGETGSTEPQQPDSQEETPAGTQAAAELEAPAAAVHSFLEAAIAGNDKGATAMLTRVAREKASDTAQSLAPERSDTTTFQIGQVEYLGENGARVGCTLSNNGSTSNMIWMVRNDPEGWRIAGTALEVFEGEPPALLDFEDPEGMEQKLLQIRQEMMRRARQASRPESGENSGNPVRR